MSGLEPIGSGTRGQVFVTDAEKLSVAIAEAELGRSEGGIPIGAALFAADGTLLGRGHNRRVQDDDASMHAETNAFRNAGRQRSYRTTTMVTTLSPCWYCCGLIRQFKIGRVVVGDDQTFSAGQHWLHDHGVALTVINDDSLITMMQKFTLDHADLWNEDIGEH